MAVKAAQVSVISTAGVVVPAANANWNPSSEDLAPSRCVIITNGSGAAAFLGGSAAVTTGNGFSLGTTTTVIFWLHPDEAVWGIVASTGTTVSYLESGS